MLILLPMDSDDIQEAKLTTVADAKIWAQLLIEEGEVVEILHNEKYDGFKKYSECAVVTHDGESVMDFLNMSMIVLVAHTQRSIDDIVEAYLFRELHDLAY
jgi:hypothetical protein